MTRLSWDAIGSRVFEAGVDHGVLYIDNTGVPWNGLTSVSESSSGGQLSEYYLDGLKYLQVLSGEEFVASIDAFTYPDEFAVCDGTRPVGHGLFMTHQRRKSFGLCYRSRIGNDVRGAELGYKLHLIYNALAAPSQRQRNSLSETVEPISFSWQITTKAPDVLGFKPTAHLVIDSRDTPSDLMATVLDILYGTDGADPRQPSVGEIVGIFNAYEASILDGGYLTDTAFNEFDAGVTPTDPQTALISGGIP